MTFSKTLNLRYNETWNPWNDYLEDEDLDRSTSELFKRDLVLSWNQLSVTVTKKTPRIFGSCHVKRKQILNNVSGFVERGTLLGIMGPSGSGKTTLMTTISQRTKGNFQGELLLNGRPVSEEEMIKISGFVGQDDVSFVELTVLEQLNLMARLKLDRSTTGETIGDHVAGLAAHLGLDGVLDTRLCHLSGGERKKVALAVQLVDDPPILFCDEISTALDSHSAMHVVNTLRRVAHAGKIVVCTIHQPASGLFDRFQQVLLLTDDGRVAYQGTAAALVNDVFPKYNYICPTMYNKAEFVLSILNSTDELDKINVNSMCKISSNVTKMYIKYKKFTNDSELEYEKHLLVKKINWITQLLLLVSRSSTCFVRDYKKNVLEFGMLMVLGVIIASPFNNLQFDKSAVQNWQGFWFTWIINTIFQYTFNAISIHHTKFSVVHREVSNGVYSLSAFYVSELIIFFAWLTLKTIPYFILVVWIVGVNWCYMQLFIFFIITLAAFSYGSLLSACFHNVDEAISFSLVYEFLSYTLSGAYLSSRTIPTELNYLRYFSLFFLGCETLSCLFWSEIKSLPYADTNNFVENGKTILNKYNFTNDNLYFDLNIMLTFCLLANIMSYFGLQNKMKKQPAY